jgi:hypothetical protein
MSGTWVKVAWRAVRFHSGGQGTSPGLFYGRC